MCAIRYFVSRYFSAVVWVNARGRPKPSRPLRADRRILVGVDRGYCGIVAAIGERTGRREKTNSAVRGGQQADDGGNGGTDDVHSGQAKVIGSVEYREARAARRDALDRFLAALADDCVIETRAGILSHIGLRCQQCNFFKGTKCTLLDQCKS